MSACNFIFQDAGRRGGTITSDSDRLRDPSTDTGIYNTWKKAVPKVRKDEHGRPLKK